SSEQTIVLDGAHNPAGAETLRAALTQFFPTQKPALILGILRDKDWTSMCRILAPLASAIYLAPVGSERTAEPAELATVCRETNSTAEVTVCRSLDEALARNRHAKLVVITGSLHFIGEAMEQLQLLPSAGEERLLNEWGAGGQGKR
ncbi:MAG: hypothetical protein HYZ36_00260, partial [Pedosphaera parvula]|nr:hypothetical protein [Pedosphaera parvula]